MQKAFGVSVRHSVLVCSAAALMLAGLTGCSGIGRALGMGKSPPDEFAVVTRAPLVIPPEFSLRPPDPGAPRPQENTPDVTARQTVFGAPPPAPELPEGTSPGEAELLALSGANRSNPDIREVLEQDARKSAMKSDKSFGDRLLFWRDSEPEPAEVIDPYGQKPDPAPSDVAGGSSPADAGESAESAPKPAAESSKGGFFSRIWPF